MDEDYDAILNEELIWDRKDQMDVSPVCGPCERISTLEVDAGIGRTRVVSEILKAAGKTGICV